MSEGDEVRNGKRPTILGIPRRDILHRVALCGVIAILLAACSPGRFVSVVNPFDNSDKDTLAALYNATGGADWKNSSGWMSDQYVGTWHGVRYVRDERTTGTAMGGQSTRIVEAVRGLELNSNGLKGEIPSELGKLDNMTHLYLGGNQLSGEIPSELGKLDFLSYLSLSRNQLSGEIPSEMGSIRDLIALNLSNNRLSGEIPPELGKLRRLAYLYLNDNQLTGEIPSGLGRLQALYVGGNQFTGCIPGRLRSVGKNDFLRLGLDFCGGGESLVPPGSDTEALVALYNAAGGENWRNNTNWMSSEPLHKWYGLSSKASRSGLIHTLSLKGNNLRGELPPELASLKGLRILNLAENDLSGDIPAELGSLRGLWTLYLGGNQFTGCIPAVWKSTRENDFHRLGLPFCTRIHDRSDTETLSAIYNALGGEKWMNNTNWLSDEPVDDWYGIVVDADGRGNALILENNRLSGEIPPELGGLVNLKRLNLRGNWLSGEIPPELGGLVNLKGLTLSGNQLSGEIPPELGNLVNLEGLTLSGNQLSGEIPPELGNLVNLEYLHLSRNQLSGKIPPELGNLVNLKRLNLSGNQLSGEIPPELGNLVNLEELHLPGNQLSGEIPPELGNLVKLDWRGLRLGGNPLTGCLPRNLEEKMSNPEFRYLGLPLCDNSGAIPGRAAPVAFYNATDGDN